MLLRPVLPRPPPPTTDGGLSPAVAGLQRGSTADTTDTEGSERKRVSDREEAAKIIQRSWRQHIVRKWFLNKTLDYDIDDKGKFQLGNPKSGRSCLWSGCLQELFITNFK